MKEERLIMLKVKLKTLVATPATSNKKTKI